jgi:predicted small secreted protein
MKGHFMRKIILAAVLLAAPLAAAACNTVEGVGKDISKAGDQLEEAAHDVKTGN